jgi:hypothetical protein
MTGATMPTPTCLCPAILIDGQTRFPQPERLAAVERALWPNDGVAALRAMPAGKLHPGHHPIADHILRLKTDRARRTLETTMVSSGAWR